jgi:hypothetical protein
VTSWVTFYSADTADALAVFSLRVSGRETSRRLRGRRARQRRLRSSGAGQARKVLACEDPSSRHMGAWSTRRPSYQTHASAISQVLQRAFIFEPGLKSDSRRPARRLANPAQARRGRDFSRTAAAVQRQRAPPAAPDARGGGPRLLLEGKLSVPTDVPHRGGSILRPALATTRHEELRHDVCRRNCKLHVVER